MRESKIQNLIQFQKRLVGLEFENPIMDAKGNPVHFRFMQNVWKSFTAHGWKTSIDPHLRVIIGAEKMIQGVNVPIVSDSGADNFEMSLPPTQTLQEGERLYKAVRKEVLAILRKHNCFLLATGMHPGKVRDPFSIRCKSPLYKAFEAQGGSDYYQNGSFIVNSAHQTGVSVRLREVLDVTNTLIQLSGLVVALSANSAIHAWNILPYKEWRIFLWDMRMVANKKGYERLCGFPEKPFQSLADYFTYFWSTPTMILPPLRDGEWISPKEKINWLEFLKRSSVRGKNFTGKPIKLIPEPKDINLAMICMWPHAKPHLVVDPKKITVREYIQALQKDRLETYLENKLINCYIEYRTAAAAPKGEEMAIPALTLGLVENIQEAKKLTKRYTWNVWKEFVHTAAVYGMQACLNGKSIFSLLGELITIAERGLKKRDCGEERYLDPLKNRIQSEETPADTAISFFKKSKKQFLKSIIYT